MPFGLKQFWLKPLAQYWLLGSTEADKGGGGGEGEGRVPQGPFPRRAQLKRGFISVPVGTHPHDTVHGARRDANG